MTETRPTGNQITFNSATTGVHVLDEYLEQAEAGGRTLGELMEDLFLPNGELRPFEFQVVSDQLQYRPPGGNWTSIASYAAFVTSLNALVTSAQTAATNASNQVPLAAAQVTLATNQVTLAANQVTLAATQATNAATSATASANSATASANSATASQNSATAAATSAASIASGPVASVNTKTGTVTLTASDVGAATPAYADMRGVRQMCRVATTADLGEAVGTTQQITGKNLSYTLAANTTSGSPNLAGITTFSTFVMVGATVSGPGIPAGTTVTVAGNTTGTLSANATATATGANLTFTNPLTPLTVDDVAVAVGNRVLVKNQTPTSQNGLYVVTDIGTTTTPWVLTRSSDMDTWEKVLGAITSVDEGTTNGNSVWSSVQTITNGTLGTTPVNWILIGNPLLSAIGNTAFSTSAVFVKISSNGVTLNDMSDTHGTGLIVRTNSTSGTISPLLKDYRLATVNLTGVAIDTANGNYFYKTVSGTTTFTFTTPATTGTQATGFVLELTNGGAFTVSWPASVKWPGGTAPSLTASGTDVLAFLTDDAGVTWRGVLSMKDSK